MPERTRSPKSPDVRIKSLINLKSTDITRR